MALKLVSAEDFTTILNLMGKYQHLVDEGDEEGWADLFTEDGAFLGLGNDAEFRGREGLKQVPRMNIAQSGGKFRHNICSFSAEYGQDKDEIFARYYMIGTVGMSGEGAAVALQVDLRTHLVRIKGDWKIKSNHMTTV